MFKAYYRCLMDNVALIANKYKALSEWLDEATLRLWAAVEARSLGRGGVSAVAKAIGISRTTIYMGPRELAGLEFASANPGDPKPRVRHPRWRMEKARRQGPKSSSRLGKTGGY